MEVKEGEGQYAGMALQMHYKPVTDKLTDYRARPPFGCEGGRGKHGMEPATR